MEEITRNDFQYFQNEILKDMKDIEKKMNEKITGISKIIQNSEINIEKRYQKFKSKIDEINKKLELNNISEDINNKLDKMNKKLEEDILINNTKLASFERDLSNACYKYDKFILNNISKPGLIGDGCPHQTMHEFLEFVNTKIKEFIASKDKNQKDIKRNEEWVKLSLEKIRLDIFDNKNEIYKFLNKEINKCDRKNEEKINLIEDKISYIKIENGKYNYNLNEKWEELEEKLKKFNKMNENLIDLYNKCRKDYIQIKSKLSDISNYLKDLKYSKNTNYRGIFEDLSKKIIINKKQKINIESNKYCNILPTISSIEDTVKLKIDKKDDNTNIHNVTAEVKPNIQPSLRKKSIKIENDGSQPEVKKIINKTKSINHVIKNSDFNILSYNNKQEKKYVFPLEKTTAKKIDFTKSTKQVFNSQFIIEEKKESYTLIPKEKLSFNNENNKAIIKDTEDEKNNNVKDNSSIINSISISKIHESKENKEQKEKEEKTDKKEKKEENENKEKKDEKEKEEEKEKEKEGEKEKEIEEEDKMNDKNNDNDINNNEDDIVKDSDTYSCMSKGNIETIDRKITNSFEKRNSMNDNYRNTSRINNVNINFNDSKLVTKINLEEEINKVNQKFDDLYEKSNLKIEELAHQIKILIKKINKIDFKRDENVKKISETNYKEVKKKKHYILNNSGNYLPYSTNKSIDQDTNVIKNDSSDKKMTMGIINMKKRTRNLLNNKITFQNLNNNSSNARTKLIEARAKSNDILNFIKEKENNKKSNYVIRMIDVKAVNKIESFLIKKFTEPN